MNEKLAFIQKLHTTHGNFTDEPVPEALIRDILESCVRGANAQNRQAYSIIVIHGADRVSSILGCGVRAPVALLFCADYNRVYAMADALGYQATYDNLFYYLTAHTDAVIASQTAVMAATALGLGTMFTNSIHNAGRKDLDELYRQLDLPEKHCFPVTAVLLGYEDHPSLHVKGRLCGPGIVHQEHYQPASREQLQQLAAYIETPENGFGGKGYLEAYYTKIRPAQSDEALREMDQMLYAHLGSFIHRAEK